MNKDNVTLRILVKGKPITEYTHNNKIYVEGREGSEFEIEITNHGYARKEILVTVDGLSINDGEPVNPDGTGSSGYLINGYQTVIIPGWSLNNKSVAAFTFEGKDKSYAAQSVNDGDVKNTGAIGMLVFNEKVKYTTNTVTLSGMGVGPHPKSSGYPGGSPFRSFNNDVNWQGASGMIGGGKNYDAAIYHTMKVGNMSAGRDNDWLETSCSHNSADSAPVAMACASMSEPEPVVQSLGAGFGKQKEFKTTQVEFDRGTLHTTLVLYYDNARGLTKRGIVLTKKVEQTEPNPFPGKKPNCPLPEGYKG